jgi:hypothetical protein
VPVSGPALPCDPGDGVCSPGEPPPALPEPLPGEPPVGPGIGSVAEPAPLPLSVGKLDDEPPPDEDEEGDELPPGDPVEPELPPDGEDEGGPGSPLLLGCVITDCVRQPDRNSAPVITSAA